VDSQLGGEAREVREMACFLRSELGYQSDHAGTVRTQLDEMRRELRRIDRTLRGEGAEMGLVAWISVLRQAWIAAAGLAGAALGYWLRAMAEKIPPGGGP